MTRLDGGNDRPDTGKPPARAGYDTRFDVPLPEPRTRPLVRSVHRRRLVRAAVIGAPIGVRRVRTGERVRTVPLP